MIPDQTAVWQRKHGNGDHENLRHTNSSFSEIAEPTFPRTALILELGCGVGRDAVYFAEHGHTVTATDSSGIVIHQDQEHFSTPKVEFGVLDMQEPLPYDSASYDVVYANLSLHYYTDEKTREIVANIAKVLKIGGFLAFACKSKDDARVNGAEEVEQNVFVAPNGHALHLFSVEYCKDILKGIFEVEHLDGIEEEYFGRASNIVRCIAKNTGKE